MPVVHGRAPASNNQLRLLPLCGTPFAARLSHMRLIRMLFWVALFLVSTFAFTVLFSHGTTNYMSNAQKEWDSLVGFYHSKVGGAPVPEPKK